MKARRRSEPSTDCSVTKGLVVEVHTYSSGMWSLVCVCVCVCVYMCVVMYDSGPCPPFMWPWVFIISNCEGGIGRGGESMERGRRKLEEKMLCGRKEEEEEEEEEKTTDKEEEDGEVVLQQLAFEKDILWCASTY